MANGIAHTLENAFNHIEDSAIVHAPNKCLIYLVSKKDHSQYIKLIFDGVKCSNSARTDCSPGVGIYPVEKGKSFIVELTESKWPKNVHERYTYPGTPFHSKYRHFVVSNHDIFHEILAESFREELVTSSSDEYFLAKKCITRQ